MTVVVYHKGWGGVTAMLDRPICGELSCETRENNVKAVDLYAYVIDALSKGVSIIEKDVDRSRVTCRVLKKPTASSHHLG